MSDARKQERYLTPYYAARFIGLSTVRLRQLAAEGTIPCDRTRSGRLYSEADLEAYLNGNSKSREDNSK
jgi:hypothetical protein